MQYNQETDGILTSNSSNLVIKKVIKAFQVFHTVRLI